MEMGDDDMEIRGIEYGNLSWPLLMAISLCLLFFSFSYYPVVPLYVLASPDFHPSPT